MNLAREGFGLSLGFLLGVAVYVFVGMLWPVVYNDLAAAPVSEGAAITRLLVLEWAIALAFWDDGFGVGTARLPRKPPDRSPEGANTLAPLGKRGRKR